MAGSFDFFVQKRYLARRHHESIATPRLVLKRLVLPSCTRPSTPAPKSRHQKDDRARRHPLDLHIMQIVPEEVPEIGKLRFVDAGRHCEGRGVGLLLLLGVLPQCSSPLARLRAQALVLDLNLEQGGLLVRPQLHFNGALLRNCTSHRTPYTRSGQSLHRALLLS